MTQSLLRIEGLVRTGDSPEDPVRAAERRLKAALDEVTALDAEIEALSEALAQFSQRHDRELAKAYASGERADRVVKRLQKLQDELRRLLGALQNPEAHPKQKGSRRAPHPSMKARRGKAAKAWYGATEGEDEDVFEEEEDVASEDSARTEEVIADSREDEAKLLKRLFRRLARILHPDLARDDEERKRLNDLMAQVNAAYERGDRTTLELIAEKVGAGEPPESLTVEERLKHLERRIAALEQAARSLKQQRDSLKATSTWRLYSEAEKRKGQGRDYFEETRKELAEEEQAALADAWHRLTSLHRAASAFSAEWDQHMTNLTQTAGKAGKKGGLARAFDPVLESALVRRGLERLEEKRASAEARALARELEERIVDAPWQVALTLLAYFAEKAIRPPDGLRTQDSWRTRYEAVRAPEAPTFEHALTVLPPHLELGMRTQKGQLHVGVQLRNPELLAGVAISLERESVAALAREVFLALGPEETCKACGEKGPLIHLLHTRGLDELNALVCQKCGATQKRYWIFSRNDGIEALHSEAQKLGVIVEQVVRFGGASIGFQLLAEQREKLKVGDLLDRLWETYFGAYKVEVARESLELYRGKGALRANANVPPGVVGARLKKSAGMSSRQAVELLRSRIERRFRPD